MAFRRGVKQGLQVSCCLLGVKILYDETYPSPFRSGLGLGSAYRSFGPLFQALFDGESAHRLAVRSLAVPRSVRKIMGLVDESEDDVSLAMRVWGINFTNPIGISAGFDKNAEAVEGLFDVGFGLVEIGSVTPLPQPGNPKPRVFRLEEDKCVINRYGFNSDGHTAVRRRLHELRAKEKQSSGRATLLGVNLGKNKTSPDAIGDYVEGVQSLGEFADYIVVNVSSPNTPGLRDMQGKKELHELLRKVQEACDKLNPRPPLLVKIAPDLTTDDARDIADVVLDLDIDGMIVSNTTIARPPTLQSSNQKETGGLSGPVLMEPSTKLLARMHKLTQGKVPLIGVGGISDGNDAYKKIRAGASLVQLYTAFSYDGPVLISEIKETLKANLERDGFKSISEAVGVDVAQLTKQ